MAREIPEVVRAAAGLAATILDETRRLPETLPGLPVRVIGIALQVAMKVQQQYSGLVARGDELFTGLRGEAEPGLATFDDDEPVPTPGFQDSAFDRAGDTITDEEVAGFPDDPAADAIVAAVEEMADQIDLVQETLDAVEGDAERTDEVLGELAIEELAIEELADAADDAVATEDGAALESALLESDGATTRTDPSAGNGAASDEADVLTADGTVVTVDATVTDEGVATPTPPDDSAARTEEGAVAAVDDAAPAPATDEGTATATATDEGGTPVAAATGVRTDVDNADTSGEDAAIAEGAVVDTVGGESDAPTDDPQGASDLSGSQAAGAAPIDGYDGFSIAQLRGRLRGYALSTVQDLVTYEEATRAREPYLRMLRNRLEKLEAQAVESSPLAPRGA